MPTKESTLRLKVEGFKEAESAIDRLNQASKRGREQLKRDISLAGATAAGGTDPGVYRKRIDNDIKYLSGLNAMQGFERRAQFQGELQRSRDRLATKPEEGALTSRGARRLGGAFVLGRAAGQVFGEVTGDAKTGQQIGTMAEGFLLGGPMIGSITAGMEIFGSAFEYIHEKQAEAAKTQKEYTDEVNRMTKAWGDFVDRTKDPIGQFAHAQADSIRAYMSKLNTERTDALTAPISMGEVVSAIPHLLAGTDLTPERTGAVETASKRLAEQRDTLKEIVALEERRADVDEQRTEQDARRKHDVAVIKSGPMNYDSQEKIHDLEDASERTRLIRQQQDNLVKLDQANELAKHQELTAEHDRRIAGETYEVGSVENTKATADADARIEEARALMADITKQRERADKNDPVAMANLKQAQADAKNERAARNAEKMLEEQDRADKASLAWIEDQQRAFAEEQKAEAEQQKAVDEITGKLAEKLAIEQGTLTVMQMQTNELEKQLRSHHADQATIDKAKANMGLTETIKGRKEFNKLMEEVQYQTAKAEGKTSRQDDRREIINRIQEQHPELKPKEVGQLADALQAEDDARKKDATHGRIGGEFTSKYERGAVDFGALAGEGPLPTLHNIRDLLARILAKEGVH